MSKAHLIPYRWQPGKSGNPGGRPNIKEGIRKVTSAWCEELAHYIFHEPEDVFMEWLAENCRTAGEKMVGKMAERVYMQHDPAAFKALLDVLVPKPRETLVVSRGPDVDTPTIDTLTDEELDRRRDLLSKANEP